LPFVASSVVAMASFATLAPSAGPGEAWGGREQTSEDAPERERHHDAAEEPGESFLTQVVVVQHGEGDEAELPSFFEALRWDPSHPLRDSEEHAPDQQSGDEGCDARGDDESAGNATAHTARNLAACRLIRDHHGGAVVATRRSRR
jgi:hypothetical protein